MDQLDDIDKDERARYKALFAHEEHLSKVTKEDLKPIKQDPNFVWPEHDPHICSPGCGFCGKDIEGILLTKTANTYGIAEKNKKYLEDYIKNKVSKAMTSKKDEVKVEILEK